MKGYLRHNGKLLKVVPSLVMLFFFITHLPLLGVEDQCPCTTTGIPVIHVEGSDAYGVSHNSLEGFNVSKQGVVIGNSCEEVCLPIIGCTPGNPNVCEHGPAEIINLNVTGNFASALEGPVHVVGKPTNLVLDNPNGIQCDGAQFINTPKVILTTKDINDPNNPFRSDIIIKGKGIQGERSLALMGRRIQVSGSMTAKEIITLEGYLQKSQADIEKNPIAIDVAPVAHIKAGSIYLMATAEGVGVRSKGTLESTQETIGVAAGEKIELKGKTQSAKDISLTAKRIEAENMQASGLYLYTKSYALDANGIRDLIHIEDLDANGERTLEYAPFRTTAQDFIFIGKTFYNHQPLHLKGLYIDLKGNPALNPHIEKGFQEYGETAMFLYSQFYNMGELIAGNFSLLATGPILNEGKLAGEGLLNIEGESFLNYKAWKQLQAGREMIARPGSGEIEAGRIQIVVTKGDILNRAAGIIRTKDPDGQLILKAQGGVDSLYCIRYNGETAIEPCCVVHGGGFDLVPGLIEAAGDLTIYSEAGKAYVKASNIKVGGNFYSNIHHNIVMEGANDQYCINAVRDRRGFKDPNHAFLCIEYKHVSLNPSLEVRGETKMISRTSDIKFEGVPLFFGKGGSIETPQGKIVIDPMFVHVGNGFKQIEGSKDNNGDAALEAFRNRMGLDEQGSAISMVGGEALLKPVGGTYVGGEMIWKARDGIYNSVTLLKGPDGNLILDAGDNKIQNESVGQKYIATNERGNHWAKYVESVAISPAMMVTLGSGNIVFKSEVENTGLIAGNIIFEKDLHNNAKVFETMAYQMQEKRRLFSKSKAEQWVKGGSVIQGTVLGNIQFGNGVKYYSEGGILENRGGTIELPEDGIIIKAFTYKPEITTKASKKGFGSTGATQMLIDRINNVPLNKAVENVPLIQYWKNAFKTKSSTDFAPPIEAAVNTFQTLETFGTSYQGHEGQEGQLKSAALDTLRAIGDFTDGGGGGFLPKLKWSKQASTTRETFSVMYPSVIHGKKVICNVDNAYIEGSEILGDESVCIDVKEDLVIKAAIGESSTEQHGKASAGIVGLNANSVSLEAYHAYMDATVQRTEHQYSKIKADTVEIRVGGKLDKGEVVIEAGDASLTADELEFTTIQDITTITEKQRSTAVGATVGAGVAIPSVSIGRGSGNGMEQSAKTQAGVHARNLKIRTNKLTLNGAVLDAPLGDVCVDEVTLSNVFDRKQYSATSWSLNSGMLGVPPVINTQQAGTSILGVGSYGRTKLEEKGVNRATIAEGINVHKPDGTPVDLEGVNRDVSKAKGTLSTEKNIWSVAVPVIDPEKFLNNAQAIAKTAQDLKDRIVEYFDTSASQVPADQPAAKAALEIARDETNKFTTEVLEQTTSLPENERIEIVSLAVRIATNPNVIKELYYQRVEITTTDDQGNRKSYIDESKIYIEKPNTERMVLSDGQVAYRPMELGFVGDSGSFLTEVIQPQPEVCGVRQVAYQFGKEVVMPVHEAVEDTVRAGVEYLYEKHPAAAKMLIEKVLIPASQKIGQATNLACIIYEVYARQQFGDAAVDYVKENYHDLKEAYYKATTPEERAGWEGIGEVATIVVGGGLKYIKEAKKVAEVAEKTVAKLLLHEKRGGHGVKKHCGKTNDEVLKRFDEEPWVKASSTFESVEVAEKYLNEALKANEAKIVEWLKNSDKLIFRIDHEFNLEIGSGYLRNNKEMKTTNILTTYLKRDETMPQGYLIKTVFPNLVDKT